MKKQQVLFIHGGTTFDSYKEYLAALKRKKISIERLMQTKWSDSLQKDLGRRFEVISPRMPNGMNAQYKEWAIIFRKIAPLLHHNVILVGHSLGAIFLAKYLSTHAFPKKIRATFLVSAPHDEVGVEESLGDFILPKKLDKFAKQGGKIFLYQSEDDPAIPFAHMEKYKKALPKAIAKGFKDRGHFTQPRFPELIRDIKGL